MSMLAFGVVVGSTVSPAQQAAAPILIAVAPPATSSEAPAPSAPSTSETSEPPANPSPETPSPASATPAAPPASSPKPKPKPKPKGGGGSTTPTTAALPPIKHVFLIVLSSQGESASFGSGSTDPYLAKTLTKQGELLPDYYAVTGGELANAIALISGQGPTPQTATDCPIYTDITPATIGGQGQVLGSGCVYPAPALTLGDQLVSAGKTWRAYVEGQEGAAPGQPTSCRHPSLGSADANQAASPSDPYVTWSNPFVYFHSVIDSAKCPENDVGLEQLAPDLASAKKTPTFAYIVPDRCHDGSQEACAPGQPTGLAAADAFLEKIVAQIELSPAYSEGALIAITFDQAPQTGPEADPGGCCLSSPYPNLPATPASTPTSPGAAQPTTTTATTPATPTSVPATTTPTTPTTSTTPATSGAGSPASQSATPAGGGKVGLLLISKYVKPASVNAIGEYNHFSLLLSIEDLFGLKPLGYGGALGLLGFDKSVYNAFR
jgi:hypothetical protein